MTYRQQFDGANACKTREEADAWMRAEIARYLYEFGVPAKEAKQVILGNIGYMAGYFGNETRDRIYRLFGAEHPIFGTKHPTPEEAFQAGIDFARKVATK